MEDAIRNKKKRRASRPKARTGCTACKSRRVKCDETKPKCDRCEEYGAFCEYQLPRPQDAASKVKDRDRDPIPIKPRHPLQLMSNPSDSLCCDEVEARYFRIFHEKLAFDLSGYFEAPFWTRLIPQQCHHHPGIKHAIIALSALYKSALSSSSHTVNLKDEHYSFALVQQRQAIVLLRNDLSGGQPQMRLALVASLLFSCFESFHGDWETATQQVYNRFNILKRLGEDEKREATNSLTGIELDVGLTVYISVSHESDETQWHEVVREVKKLLDAVEWTDVQVHIEHNEGMVGDFDNLTSLTSEQWYRGNRLKKRIGGRYYSTVHIGDDFSAACYIKRSDGERLSPTNGTIGCFVQLKTCDPEPTWRTFILTSYQAVRPAFDGFTVTPNGADSKVAPPTANSDLWTVDSVGYTPNSPAKPATFESPSRLKHHFNIHHIDQEVAGLMDCIEVWEKMDRPKKEKQLQKFREIIAALRDERKQKTDFFKTNKQALGRLYAASGFRRRLVGRRMDWALIEVDRPWHDRLPGLEEWAISMYSGIPFMTLGMQLQEQTRSIEALRDLAWSNSTFDVYKIGTSSGPTAGSLLCTNNLVTIRDDQYMNPSPTEEMAFEPRRYTYGSERGFCAPGDSGSVVFDKRAGIVGLMIGGHQNNNSYNHGYGYVTPIEYVFKDIRDLLKGHVLDIRIAEL